MTLDAGLHVGVPAAVYHTDPCGQPSLSSSIARLLCTASPAHAAAAHPRLNPELVRATSSEFDLGQTVHAVFLEGEAAVDVVQADAWRTKDAKEQRAASYEAGRIPLLEKQWQRTGAAVESIRRVTAAFQASPPLFRDGDPEVCAVWDEDGVTCRALLDWLRDDFAAIDDLKSTALSANPRTWHRRVFEGGYDVQAEFYSRGVERITGTRPIFRLVVVELDAPHAVSVIRLAPDAEALAARKVDYAVELWRRCMASGSWPAYEQRVAFASVPVYEESRWLELELADPYGAFGKRPHASDDGEVPF